MDRQIYQKYGLAIALIVAGISLPTAIASISRETALHHYYEDTYYYNQTYIYYNETYYNQTINGDNEAEPDYTKPLETTEYYNLNQYEYFTRNFTLSSSYAYWLYYNASVQVQLYFYVIRAVFLERLIDLNGTVEILGFIDDVEVYGVLHNQIEQSISFTPPFLAEWLFVYIDGSVPVNISLTDEILKI